MTRPPFPTVIDSSMLSAWRSCSQKFFRTYLEHWKPAAESVHLVAGKAFAHGLEHARRAFYIDKLPVEDAMALGIGALWESYGFFECPPESPKNALRMAGALEYYFEAFPLGADKAEPIDIGGRKGIEFSFVEPFPFDHPETGDPILYSGRADLVANSMGGIFIFDEKTASQLGASWMKQWDLRPQFTAYCWGLRQNGVEANGVITRGISILSSGYGNAQVPTYRASWEVERWVTQTQRDLQRMVQQWQEGYWDYNLDHSCTEYGGCAFQRICKSANPEKWLPMYFHQRRWDPVTRSEDPLPTT